ncbi:MAG: LamB/YcsF family protein, partial [Pseudomonadota bacterium]
AVKATDPDMIFLVLPGSELEKAGEKLGLRVAREVFADRAYDDDGMLVSRKLPDAMIHEPDVAGQRMVRFVQDGAIESVSGKKIPAQIDSICVHGDGPAAVEMARSVRSALAEAGVDIRPLADVLG